VLQPALLTADFDSLKSLKEGPPVQVGGLSTPSERARMSQRSYVRWNIAGIVIAITGFAVGSLKGVMGAGGAHSTIGAIVGLTGAVIATTAFALEHRRRRHLRREPLA
jgi:membrane associated rhomboid family serine protease